MSEQNIIQRSASDFWFACVDIDVLDDERLTPIEKVVFTLLCRYASPQNRAGYPSIKKLALKANCSDYSVQKAIKRLIELGLIERQERFINGRQTTSLYKVIGFNAPCYRARAQKEDGGSNTLTPPPTILTNGGQRDVPQKDTSMKDIKDSLTGEVELPDFPDKAKDSGNNTTPHTPNQEVLDSSPKEVCTPDDVPEIFKQTAKYFLYETKRSGLTEDEVSAFRTLAADHTPARVQKEIDTACDRFRRHGKALSTLTISYIAGALQHQQSRRKRKDKAKPDTTMTGITSADIERLEKDLTPEEIARIEKFEREGGIL